MCRKKRVGILKFNALYFLQKFLSFAHSVMYYVVQSRFIPHVLDTFTVYFRRDVSVSKRVGI